MTENESRILGVRTFSWNPVRFSKESSSAAPVNNFGDLLGPIVISGLLRNSPMSQRVNKRLLSIGSILHFAEDGDIIWGSGINGKVGIPVTSIHLDVRAVRGPRTQAALRNLGVLVPETMGDPALLLPTLYPELISLAGKKVNQILLVPNLNDTARYRSNPHLCLPQDSPLRVIKKIIQSEFVVGSSLHAMIIADAFGIPSRPIHSVHESEIKYRDYYEGTQRFGIEFASSFEHALELGPVARGIHDIEGLLTSFPSDLWPGMKQPNIASFTGPSQLGLVGLFDSIGPVAGGGE